MSSECSKVKDNRIFGIQSHIQNIVSNALTGVSEINAAKSREALLSKGLGGNRL